MPDRNEKPKVWKGAIMLFLAAAAAAMLLSAGIVALLLRTLAS